MLCAKIIKIGSSLLKLFKIKFVTFFETRCLLQCKAVARVLITECIWARAAGDGSNGRRSADVPRRRLRSGRSPSSPSCRRSVLPCCGHPVTVRGWCRSHQLIHRSTRSVCRQPGSRLLDCWWTNGYAPARAVCAVRASGGTHRGAVLDSGVRLLDSRRAPLDTNLRRDRTRNTHSRRWVGFWIECRRFYQFFSKVFQS